MQLFINLQIVKQFLVNNSMYYVITSTGSIAVLDVGPTLEGVFSEQMHKNSFEGTIHFVLAITDIQNRLSEFKIQVIQKYHLCMHGYISIRKM